MNNNHNVYFDLFDKHPESIAICFRDCIVYGQNISKEIQDTIWNMHIGQRFVRHIDKSIVYLNECFKFSPAKTISLLQHFPHIYYPLFLDNGILKLEIKQ